MSSRASGGALAASLITAAIIGFAGGAYFGTQAGGGTAGADNPPDDTSAATTEPEEPSTGDADGEPTTPSSETPAADSSLTLTATQESVAPDQNIDLSGALDPPEEGVVLRVQRQLDGGSWELFPSAENPLEWTTKADGTFKGSINTGRTGLNGIRVVRVDDESVVSNVVEVTVG